MKVLFFDPTAKERYTSNTVKSYAMGASEASLMRVAVGLAALPGFEVSVFQVVDQSRNEAVIDGVRHINLNSQVEPDVVIHQRSAKFVEDLAIEYPKARHIVWMHDLGHESWLKDEPLTGKELVCVSDFHVEQMLVELNKLGMFTKECHRIYNPVVVDAKRQEKVKGRLGFFSSPQKGLEQVLHSFNEARARDSSLSLVLANPGYIKHSYEALPGVTVLGELSHSRCLEELSKCEALFYPQTVFPETMGVILAEANAMNVPVLCHNMGAALEVLEGTGMNEVGNAVRDCTNPENVRCALNKLLKHGWPVEADPRFALNNIVDEWRKLLEQNPVS